jgi:hypothetical protein
MAVPCVELSGAKNIAAILSERTEIEMVDAGEEMPWSGANIQK